MSYEVVHTSVMKGLRGESGFATAIVTRGMPAGLESGLQDVSGYDHDAARSIGVDETEWAHRIVTVRGRPYTVLSRIAPNGVDASRRPNRIAHHLVLEQEERDPRGPAWMLKQFGAWEVGTPEVAERECAPTLPNGSNAAERSNRWKDAGFDQGWAGVVAQTLLDEPQSTIYLVLPEMLHARDLLVDVLALLPVDRRWLATFSTRPLVVLPTVRCQLRLVRADAPGLGRLLREPGVKEIRINKEPQGAGEGAAAIAGRAGTMVEPAVMRLNSRVNPVIAAAVPWSRGIATRETPRTPEPGPSHTLREGNSIRAPTPVPVPASSSSRVWGSRNDVASNGSRMEGWPGLHPLSIALFVYSAVALFGAGTFFLLAAWNR